MQQGPGAGSTSLASFSTNSFVKTNYGSDGQIILSSGNMSTSVSFNESSSGATTLTSSATPSNTELKDVGAINLYLQSSGGKPLLQGSFLVKEAESALSVEPSIKSNTDTKPETGSSSEGITFNLSMPDGKNISLLAEMTADNHLVITVPPGTGELNNNNVMLMGMVIAKQQMKADLKKLNGIVIKKL